MKRLFIFTIPIITFVLTGCLIKQPEENIVYNINIIEDDSSTSDSTSEQMEDMTDASAENIEESETEESETEVMLDNYSEETLEFDRLIKEIADQTQE